MGCSVLDTNRGRARNRLACLAALAASADTCAASISVQPSGLATLITMRPAAFDSIDPLLRTRVRTIPRGGDQQQQNNASGGQGLVPGASAAAYGVPADPSTPPPPPDRVDSPPAGYDYIDAQQHSPGGHGQPGAYDEHIRETVEENISAWRLRQQQIRESIDKDEGASVSEATLTEWASGISLFAAVSRASVSIFFFILMWRTVHHYESADAAFGAGGGGPGKMLKRNAVCAPLVILFLGELVGAVMGLSGGKGGNGSRSTKRRLKGVLNLHKAVELMTMTYNVIRLAVWPSKYVPREVYIGRTVSNFFFFMQCQLYTSLSWDGVKENTDGEFSTYEDYSAEEPQYYGNSPQFDGGVSQDQQQQQQQRYDNSSGWN